jgi:hypothetical protein
LLSFMSALVSRPQRFAAGCQFRCCEPLRQFLYKLVLCFVCCLCCSALAFQHVFRVRDSSEQCVVLLHCPNRTIPNDSKSNRPWQSESPVLHFLTARVVLGWGSWLPADTAWVCAWCKRQRTSRCDHQVGREQLRMQQGQLSFPSCLET